jgi:hypothetical protein
MMAKKYKLKISVTTIIALDNLFRDIVKKACEKAIEEKATTLRPEHFV